MKRRQLQLGGLLLGATYFFATACRSDDGPGTPADPDDESAGGTTGGSAARAGGGTGGASGAAGADVDSESADSSGASGSAGMGSRGDSTDSGACNPANECCGQCQRGDSCESHFDCASGLCVNDRCAECEPGSERCAGSTPQLCLDSGVWEGDAQCSGATPSCIQGRCVVCADGETRLCGDCGTQVCSNETWGECQQTVAPSCASTPACNGESCCQGLAVEGGNFLLGTLASYPASVDGFCLDKYEVTVGRFREFLDNYDAWEPMAGAGEHRLGAGSGWQIQWDKGDELPADASEFAEALECGDEQSHPTWRPSASDSADVLPQNCMNWYEALAFCIWDGGRLATEAEWEYAASGGAEERLYAWGDQEPDETSATFDCCGAGSCGSCSAEDLLAVGSKPLGNGRWGHSDLSGSMNEWVFDGYSPYFSYPCDNCVAQPGAYHIQHGGSWLGSAPSLRVTARPLAAPAARSDALGARCVRTR